MSKISTMLLLTALAVGIISLSIDSTAIFAQTATSISIVPGSSAPNNPKFYDPSPANVAVGTTVTWTNDDDFMTKGKTFSHTFDTAGTFDYYCTLHPFMIGQVVVK
ncbi:MAG: mauC 1 [Nitrososphaeraceae archaeon]|nr:mauC 1 [Nitrososphaeraceae archaeon]